jgi:hypothetical protein
MLHRFADATSGAGFIGLFAVVALLALVPTTAAAARTITVNDKPTDEPLNSADHLTACVSMDVTEECTLRAAVELANEDSKE